MRFKKGKWYTPNGVVFTKFDQIAGSTFLGPQHYAKYNNGYRYLDDKRPTWIFKVTDSIREATQEELNTFLPPGHIDKIIEPIKPLEDILREFLQN